MKPLPDDERARIVTAIEAGGSRNQIARDFHRAPSTITAVAVAAGLTFDRSATKHAREALAEDNAMKRTRLASSMLDDALRLREQLWQPAVVYHFTKDGQYVEHEHPEPTFTDKRNISVSVKVLADGAAGLEREGATDAPARGMLARLMDGIRTDRTEET